MAKSDSLYIFQQDQILTFVICCVIFLHINIICPKRLVKVVIIGLLKKMMIDVERSIPYRIVIKVLIGLDKDIAVQFRFEIPTFNADKTLLLK